MTRATYSPCLQGAHRYTTRGGISVRSPRGKFHLQWTMPASWHMRRALSVLRQPKGETTIPLRKLRLLPFSELCVQTKAKVRLLSAHKVYGCAPLPYRQNVGAAYG